MSPQKVIAARDPNGFRPLVIGKLNDTNFVFASETCALDVIGADFVREVEPGEIVVVEKGREFRSRKMEDLPKQTLCSFEYIYFSRPDSILNGFGIDEARREMGKMLARKAQIDADIVVPVPDSGISAANGYAEESGIPFQTGLIKNRYVARTFIAPSQIEREKKVKLKLNPLRQSISGKRVILIDDSIVRGTTSKAIVSEVRRAGAKEVHFVSSSPPFAHPCYFGTDVPDTNLLFINNNALGDREKYLGVDSLTYLDISDLREIFKERGIGICDACFSGEYPIKIEGNPPTHC
jgi:amidophosphoribosyltransferase